MKTSWRTTTLGILAIVTAVTGAAQALLSGGNVDWSTTIAAVLAGIGLIKAKDSQVTGGTIKQ